MPDDFAGVSGVARVVGGTTGEGGGTAGGAVSAPFSVLLSDFVFGVAGRANEDVADPDSEAVKALYSGFNRRFGPGDT